MLKALTFAAALAFAGSAVAAPALDAQGKCRDGGKFVAAEKCKTAKPAAAQKCKNDKGQYAKCGTPGAKPVKG